MRFRARHRAFTLLELLCVIGIIAILATLYFGVFPKVFGQVNKLGKRQKDFNKGIEASEPK
ncbi:MAG TPA: type II secretion system protein [Verrucomicrobiae bacterium]|nr:type II secretion system protein [Verrucomicrobiae bacterium]